MDNEGNDNGLSLEAKKIFSNVKPGQSRKARQSRAFAYLVAYFDVSGRQSRTLQYVCTLV